MIEMLTQLAFLLILCLSLSATGAANLLGLHLLLAELPSQHSLPPVAKICAASSSFDEGQKRCSVYADKCSSAHAQTNAVMWLQHTYDYPRTCALPGLLA